MEKYFSEGEKRRPEIRLRFTGYGVLNSLKKSLNLKTASFSDLEKVLKTKIKSLKMVKGQPPSQALRFSHGRGERETSDW